MTYLELARMADLERVDTLRYMHDSGLLTLDEVDELGRVCSALHHGQRETERLAA